MKELSELVLSHGGETESTSFPFWCISDGNKASLLAGFWFNRKDAEDHLDGHRYRFPKDSCVYCFSGHDSPHVRRLYELARAEVKA